MTPQHDFRTIQGCPVGMLQAPYIAIIADDAHATVNSIYRGTDAEPILAKHGKSSQRQLYDGFVNHRPGFYPANPPGYSTHEQHSDGVAYPHYPRGAYLEWWQVGFDVDDQDVDRCIEIAAAHGWHLWRPYPGGSEHHHLNFASEPKPGKLELRIERLRATLPRS